MSCLNESSKPIGIKAFQEVPGVKAKCFIIQHQNAQVIEDILVVYKHVSLREEDFLFDLLCEFTGRIESQWPYHCKWAYQFGLPQEEIDKANYAFEQLYTELKDILLSSHFYDKKGLIFNSIWIQKPDIFVFFRTEHSDVDFSGFVDYHAPDDSEHPA